MISWNIKCLDLKNIFFIYQRKYTFDLLQETDMSACQLANTHVEEGLKLYVDFNQIPINKKRFQRLV